MFELSRQRMFPSIFSKPENAKARVNSRLAAAVSAAMPSSRSAAMPSSRSAAMPSSRRVETPRELPDVTGFLVVVLVTLGLFVVPVGATIMQGPAIVASIFGR